MGRHSWIVQPSHGSTLMKAGNTYSGQFYVIHMLSRVTFTTLADASSPANSWAEVSLAADTYIIGIFTDATVSTGTAVAYKTGDKTF